jgi:membrane-associated phospholipid phosphatase
VVLVLAIGCGFIVNFGLKDHFHRARPRDVVEFGGTKLFSPAFQVSNQCKTNCSFSSGDAAGGFFCLALALALSRRRAAYIAGLGVGVVMSIARISSGAHFLSDTVTSFFVMLLVADVLYYYLLVPRPEPQESRGTRGPAAACRGHHRHESEPHADAQLERPTVAVVALREQRIAVDAVGLFVVEQVLAFQ